MRRPNRALPPHNVGKVGDGVNAVLALQLWALAACRMCLCFWIFSAVKVAAMATNRIRTVTLSAGVLGGSGPLEHRQFLVGEEPIPGLEASLSCDCGSWWVVLGRWLAHAVSSIELDHERPHGNLEAWA